MENKKTKVKYDKWFLVILAVLLWTIVNQLFSLTSWLPGNWANLNLWFKIIASCIATFGVCWVIKIYISNAKRQAARIFRIEQAIKDHPELAGIIKDIIGE